MIRNKKELKNFITVIKLKKIKVYLFLSFNDKYSKINFYNKLFYINSFQVTKLNALEIKINEIITLLKNCY